MPDDRDTGEHFIGSLVERPEGEVQVSARRIADLATQIDFLDLEVSRYRQMLEAERISHATELGEIQLDADTRLDEERRKFRNQAKTIHDSYRALLADQQIEFERVLSEATASHERVLIAERSRYESIVDEQRSRHESVLDSSRRQSIDEVTSSREQADKRLASELTQSTNAVRRLQAEVDSYAQRASSAEDTAHDRQREITALQRRLNALSVEQTTRLDDAQKQLTTAHHRIEAERRRAAATLAELLNRSASIAAEADKARSDAAAAKAMAKHAAATAHERAQAEYADLASAASRREAELERVIAELRAELRAQLERTKA